LNVRGSSDSGAAFDFLAAIVTSTARRRDLTIRLRRARVRDIHHRWNQAAEAITEGRDAVQALRSSAVQTRSTGRSLYNAAAKGA